MSVKVTPVSVVEPLGFRISKLIVDCPPTAIELGLNEVVMAGGAIPDAGTMRVAVLLVVPVPPWVELMAPVVLLNVPVLVVVVTLMLKEHDPPAPSVPLDKPTEVDPAVPPFTVPPQLFTIPGTAPTCIPLGNASVKPIPLSEVVPLGFWMKKFSVAEPPVPIVAGKNDLLIVGGAVPATV